MSLFRIAFKSFGILGLITLFAGTPSFGGGHCTHCNETGNLQQCSACYSAEYCKKECQLAHWSMHKAQCHAFKALKDGVEIRESTIPNSGLGLFTKKVFKKDEIIAVYYGEKLVRKATRPELTESPFALGLPDGSFVLGQSNPLPPAHLAAQFANDPFIDSQSLRALYTLDCSADNTRLVQRIATQYLDRKFAADPSQVVHVDFYSFQFPVFRANGNIKSGSEVFFSYGLSYWMNRAFGVCDRKGLPVQGLKMVRAVSEAVEKYPGLGKKDFHSVYMGYLSKQDYRTNLKGYTDKEREIPMRITSLFNYPHYLQMRILNPEAFEILLGELKVREELEEISKLDNTEFLGPDSVRMIHPRSIALLQNMTFWNMKSDLDPPAFLLSDVTNQCDILGDALCELLRLDPIDPRKLERGE